jgi:adenosine deaminase
MIESGLNVIIASDDPGIFGKTLVDNYIFASELGVSIDVLSSIAKNSLMCSLLEHV